MLPDKQYPHPLNDSHCDCLNKVLERTASALQLAKDCADCGLDTSEFVEQLQAQQAMAQKLKGKFFPARM